MPHETQDEASALDRSDRLLAEGVSGDRGGIAAMIYEAVMEEREACAVRLEAMTLDAICLGVGELGKAERRLVKVLLPWLANQIRNIDE